jgi:uncharacterized protein
VTLDELATRLRHVLQSHPGVRFAVLFGSATRDLERARDIDVAVSFATSPALMELALLANRLEDAVGRPVDVVDVEAASTLLRWEVVSHGMPVVVHERDALLDFQARVPIEYADLRPYFDRESEGLRRSLQAGPWSGST